MAHPLLAALLVNHAVDPLFRSARLAFALLCVIAYLLLRSAKQIAGFLGENLMKIITKMMGLLLFSIGIQMIIVSVQTLIK